ncbi:MAG: DUF481 domain-containing protein [Planctomycetes bacterium]|nr:DUF481 domain-containing protein [Planctomycetota bacterium]
MKSLLAPTLLILALAGTTFAQDGAPEEDLPDVGVDAEEIPPPPADEVVGGRSFVLTTGETLQGELIQIKGGTVKLKSDQLGTQEVPLDKIRMLSTDKAHKVKMPGGGIVEGTVRIRSGMVTVTPTDGSAATSFPVGDLGAVNPDPEKTELDYWSFVGTVGGTATYGNTRTRTLFVLLNLAREDEYTRSRIGFTSVYGIDATRGGGGENAKSSRLDFQVDYKINERIYLIPAVGHVLYDKFQNIERRGSIGSGAGYNILIEDDLKWSAEAGFSYTETRLRRTPPNRGPATNIRNTSTAARVATNFHWAMSDRVSFDLFWESFLGTKRIKDTFHRSTFNLGYKLFGGLALGLGGIYDRVETPGRSNSGRRVKRDDFKLTVTLTLSF